MNYNKLILIFNNQKYILQYEVVLLLGKNKLKV
jgi:hypothetical protein